jgi:hypothetical protein
MLLELTIRKGNDMNVHTNEVSKQMAEALQVEQASTVAGIEEAYGTIPGFLERKPDEQAVQTTEDVGELPRD